MPRRKPTSWSCPRASGRPARRRPGTWPTGSASPTAVRPRSGTGRRSSQSCATPTCNRAVSAFSWEHLIFVDDICTMLSFCARSRQEGVKCKQSESMAAPVSVCPPGRRVRSIPRTRLQSVMPVTHQQAVKFSLMASSTRSCDSATSCVRSSVRLPDGAIEQPGGKNMRIDAFVCMLRIAVELSSACPSNVLMSWGAAVGC